jgi:acyl transferase domain-containing protein
MEPRQRLALELIWELFEYPFILPETLRGERVAVYLGAMTDDYAVLTLRDIENLDHHSFTSQPGHDRQQDLVCLRPGWSSMTVDSANHLPW